MTRILVWLASRRNPSPTQRQKHQPRFHQIGHLRLGKGFYHGHCHPGLRRPRWEEEPGLELELLRHTHTSDDNPFLCRHKYQPTTHTRLQHNSIRPGCCRHQTEHSAPFRRTPILGRNKRLANIAPSYESAIVPRRQTFLEETPPPSNFLLQVLQPSPSPTHTKRPAGKQMVFITTWTDGTDGAEQKGLGLTLYQPLDQLRRAGRKGLGISLYSLRTLIWTTFLLRSLEEIFVARLDSTEPG